MITSICTALLSRCAGNTDSYDIRLQPLVTTERILLHGENSAGKTSIAFRIAYEYAVEGLSSLIICRQSKLEQCMPLYIHDAPLSNEPNVQQHYEQSYDPEMLSMIQMKYVTTPAECKAVLVGLHAFMPRPSLVIVEDLSALIDPSTTGTAHNDSQILDECIAIGEILTDTLNFMNKSLTQSHDTAVASIKDTRPDDVKAIVTESSNDFHFQRVLQRSFPCSIHLERGSDISSDGVKVTLRTISSAVGGKKTLRLGRMLKRGDHLISSTSL